NSLITDQVRSLFSSNPTPKAVDNVIWRPYKPSEEGYLFIYLNSGMRYKFRPLHMAFWRERFYKLAELVPREFVFFDSLAARSHNSLITDQVRSLFSSNPTPKAVDNVIWRPYKPSEEGYLFIYLNSGMRYKFRPLHMAFWRERFYKLAELVPPSPLLIYRPFAPLVATVVYGILTLLLVFTLCLFVVLLRRQTRTINCVFKRFFFNVVQNSLITDQVRSLFSSNPTPKAVDNVIWRPYKPSEEGYLFIYLNSGMRYKFRPLHMAFWRERFYKLAELVPPSPLLIYRPFAPLVATVVYGILTLLLVFTLCLFVVLLRRQTRSDNFLSS
ncbi:hypothetical protein AHF37_04609, partial [Paragonimus kellicotti]